MELTEKKGKRFLMLKELSMEHGLKENREVFLSISKRTAALRNVKKNLLLTVTTVTLT